MLWYSFYISLKASKNLHYNEVIGEALFMLVPVAGTGEKIAENILKCAI
jgi:hypothetical protein